jgi:hypothetical protein
MLVRESDLGPVGEMHCASERRMTPLASWLVLLLAAGGVVLAVEGWRRYWQATAELEAREFAIRRLSTDRDRQAWQ